MKRLIIVCITMIALTTGYKATAQFDVNFNTFYNELSPYGRWINNNDYGQVWIANETGFEPYSNSGHWEYTTYGWTWVSDYSWGWAPFHYGRWAYIPAYGWAWVPGYEWAPAWVSWCQYDGYYGWAPLSPGWGFNMGFNSIPIDRWRFVRYQYLNNPRVYRHYERPIRSTNVYNNVTIINNTQVNNNITYAAGPQQAAVEKVINKKIPVKEVAFTATPQKTEVTKGQVKLFRPEGRKDVINPTTPKTPAVTTQPAAPLQREKDIQIKQAAGANTNDPKSPVKTDVQLNPQKTEGQQPVKGNASREMDQPVKRQPADQQTLQQQNELKRQEATRQPAKEVQQVEQGKVQQQQELRRQQQDQQRLKEQQASEQQRLQQQNEQRRLAEQQQRQQQQNEQRRQAAEQQRLQQQNEQRQQAAEEARLRRQEELRQQQMQQQQRQQQLQQQRREQQQQIRQQEREQKAMPLQLPQRKNDPAPPPAPKKGKG